MNCNGPTVFIGAEIQRVLTNLVILLLNHKGALNPDCFQAILGNELTELDDAFSSDGGYNFLRESDLELASHDDQRKSVEELLKRSGTSNVEEQALDAITSGQQMIKERIWMLDYRSYTNSHRLSREWLSEFVMQNRLNIIEVFDREAWFPQVLHRLLTEGRSSLLFTKQK